MNETWKAARLDFSLLRPYWKSYCLIILLPVIYTGVARSLVAGISFGMCIIGITTSYTFAISEKNGMERLYGILPVARRHLVFGKYLLSCLAGILGMTVWLAADTALLKALGETVEAGEIVINAAAGLLLYTVYTAFQLPGYYKFGVVGGKVFQFVPVMGYILTLVLLPYVDWDNPVLVAALGRPAVLAATAVLLCAAAYMISIGVSVRILRNKEV